MNFDRQITEKNCARLRLAITPIVVALLITLGCAGNYGRLVQNQEINKIFNTYRVLSDYRYYFSGPEGRPDAVMGILRDYTLESTQWTEVDLTGEQLKKLIDSINFYHRGRTRNYPYGFLILDHNGNQIGIWYSIWDWTTVIVKEDKRVEIYAPLRDDRFGDGDQRERMKQD